MSSQSEEKDTSEEVVVGCERLVVARVSVSFLRVISLSDLYLLSGS